MHIVGLKKSFQRRKKQVATFQRTETVDARQFTGGKENGASLALWVNSNGQMTETRAEWLEATEVGTKTLPERVRVHSVDKWNGTAFTDDWIVQKQDGTFEVLRPELLILEGYVQV
jgi:hypothetical protein